MVVTTAIITLSQAIIIIPILIDKALFRVVTPVGALDTMEKVSGLPLQPPRT